MRTDWAANLFEDCLETVSYPSKVQRQKFQAVGRFPIISQERDFINGYWDNEEDVLRVDRPLVVFGDHTQILKYVDFDFVIGADGVKLLKPKTFIDPKFFYYFLMANPISNAGYARHYRFLKELTVHYPPLPEQQRIVAILDEAFAGLATATANAEKNLKNARNLFDNQVNLIFGRKGPGSTNKKLSDLIDVTHGFAFDGKHFSDVGSDYPVLLTPANFTELGTLDFNEKNTKRFTGRVSPSFVLRSGDLVVVMTDLSSKMKILGKPAFADRDGLLHNQRIGRIVFRDRNFWPEYLYYFFRTADFMAGVKDTATGTMVKHTAPKRIMSAVISVPATLNEQKLIASELRGLSTEVEKLEALYRNKVFDLTVLRQSILQKAFSGELTSPPSQAIQEAAE